MLIPDVFHLLDLLFDLDAACSFNIRFTVSKLRNRMIKKKKINENRLAFLLQHRFFLGLAGKI